MIGVGIMGKKKPDKNELVKQIITELGVDIDETNKTLIDQETQTPIVFNNKKLKLIENDSDKPGKGETAFDPIENRKLMASLLAFNNEKAVEEGTASPICVFYPLDTDKDGKGKIELKDRENKKFTSRPYYNDSLKIADIMFKMNGNDTDLTQYDEKIVPITASKKRNTVKK